MPVRADLTTAASISIPRWIRLLLAVGGLAAVSYLIVKIGPGAIWRSLSTMGWGLALVLCFPYMLSPALDTLGWRVLFRAPRPSFWIVLRARLAGEAVNLTTPTASVGGEPVKAYLLGRHVPLVEAFATLIVDKATVLIGQALSFIAGLVLAKSLLPASSPLWFAMGALLVVEIAAISGFIVVQIRGVVGGGGRILARLVARMSMDKAERYQSGFEHLDRTLAALYRERPGRIVVSALVHALAWAGGGLELYIVLRLQGTPAPLLTAMVIESFAAAVKFASFMVPASLGALEGGVVAFFEAFGLSGAAGLSYVLIRRLREAVWAGVGFVLLTGWDRRTTLGSSESP